jgi:hypothetical protein
MLSGITTKYAVTIDLQFGQLSGLIKWCQSQCKDKWDYTVMDMAGATPGKYQFNFINETDYINFILFKK